MRFGFTPCWAQMQRISNRLANFVGQPTARYLRGAHDAYIQFSLLVNSSGDVVSLAARPKPNGATSTGRVLDFSYGQQRRRFGVA